MLTIDEAHGQVIVRHADGSAEVHAMDTPEAFEAVSAAWLRCGWDVKYVYGFTWMGRPIIQLPEDMIRIQELIWRPAARRDRRDRRRAWRLAGLLRGPVRGHERRPRDRRRYRYPHRITAPRIEAHPMAPAITLIEGSSIAPDTVAAVRAQIAPDERCW